MAVVVSDDFVGFQIPAFDHFVFAAREEVGVSWRNGQTAHCRNVARESEFERAGCEIPDFDGAVAST